MMYEFLLYEFKNTSVLYTQTLNYLLNKTNPNINYYFLYFETQKYQLLKQ